VILFLLFILQKKSLLYWGSYERSPRHESQSITLLRLRDDNAMGNHFTGGVYNVGNFDGSIDSKSNIPTLKITL